MSAQQMFGIIVSGRLVSFSHIFATTNSHLGVPYYRWIKEAINVKWKHICIER